MLRGRRRECEVLAGLLEGVRGGRSGVLVVRGEAGVGKTALLDYAVEWALDLKVLRAVGVESEMELAFAALHQVCGPMLDRLEGLPGPQRAALGAALGLQAGPAPDRFLVGLAVLSLLSEAAQERPLLCVIDDAQWLDRESAQALAFAARRLLAESLREKTRLLLVVAAADPVGDPALVWRAARKLELSIEVAGYAEAARLLEIAGRVVFRHPLVRSAVYRAASLSDRQKVHAALAEMTDPQVDPDRRAWHRAQATSGPDEDVAAELEQCAGRAQARGGLAAAAAFL